MADRSETPSEDDLELVKKEEAERNRVLKEAAARAGSKDTAASAVPALPYAPALGTAALAGARTFFGSPDTAAPAAPAAPPENKEPSTPGLDRLDAMQDRPSAPSTPGLDRLDAMQDKPSSIPPSGERFKGLERLDTMQNSPMGSTSTLQQRRSLESDSGKGFRMARKLKRLGYDSAAEKMAFGAASSKMAGEPAVKTEEFRELEDAQKKKAAEEFQSLDQMKRKQLNFQDKLLNQQNKDLASGKFDYRKYAPSA